MFGTGLEGTSVLVKLMKALQAWYCSEQLDDALSFFACSRGGDRICFWSDTAGNAFGVSETWL